MRNIKIWYRRKLRGLINFHVLETDFQFWKIKHDQITQTPQCVSCNIVQPWFAHLPWWWFRTKIGSCLGSRSQNQMTPMSGRNSWYKPSWTWNLINLAWTKSQPQPHLRIFPQIPSCSPAEIFMISPVVSPWGPRATQLPSPEIRRVTHPACAPGSCGYFIDFILVASGSLT